METTISLVERAGEVDCGRAGLSAFLVSSWPTVPPSTSPSHTNTILYILYASSPIPHPSVLLCEATVELPRVRCVEPADVLLQDGAEERLPHRSSLTLCRVAPETHLQIADHDEANGEIDVIQCELGHLCLEIKVAACRGEFGKVDKRVDQVAEDDELYRGGDAVCNRAQRAEHHEEDV